MKLMINLKPKSIDQDQVKIITNRSRCTIKYAIYIGKIRFVNYLKEGIRRVKTSKDYEEVKMKDQII